MKVKALCGIFYKGHLYSAGEIFEADEFLKNTEDVLEETKLENSESPDGTGDDNPENGENPEEKGAEKSEDAGTEKSTTKRR